MKIQEKFPQKLLVEGNDDQHIIWALCQKYSLTHNFDAIDCVGLILQVVFVVSESFGGEAVPFGFPFIRASGFGSIAFKYVEGRLGVCCSGGGEVESDVGDVSFLVTLFSSKCVFGLS